MGRARADPGGVDQLSHLAPEQHTYDGPKESSGETLLSLEEMKQQILQVDADLSHWPQLRTAMNLFVGRLVKMEQIGVATRIRLEIERVDEMTEGDNSQ